MALLNASWSGAVEYKQVLGRVRASWATGTGQYLLPIGLLSKAKVGAPRLRSTQYAAPASILANPMGSSSIMDGETGYAHPQFVVNASWHGAVPYRGPYGAIIMSWNTKRVTIAPGGFDQSGVGEPLLYGSQFIRPEGWRTDGMGIRHWAIFDWQYAPPQWTLNASWVGKDAYAAPHGTLTGAWALPAEAKQVSLTGWRSDAYGTPSVGNRRIIVRPAGFLAQGTEYSHNVRNGAAQLKPAGFSALSIGNPTLVNMRQYVLAKSFDAVLWGVPFMRGGVKEVKPTGFASMRIGSHGIYRDRTIEPGGIAWPGMGAASVSPRILYAKGILGTLFGTPYVQFPPQPKGWLSSAMGYPVVEYKTRWVRPGGLPADELGYPRVRDRAQHIWPSSAPVASVFGDIAVRLTLRKIIAAGFDAHEPNPWASVRSNRRSITVSGWAAGATGVASIRNATPSFAPAPWVSTLFGNVVIGWHVRNVFPSGIPQTLNRVPAPLLQQTPSFTPTPIVAPTFPLPTVWARNRPFDIQGFDSQRVGSVAVGFRQRSLRDVGGIDGVRSGDGRVEHVDRAVGTIGAEFLRHGVAWVSFGLRYVEPVSIEHIDVPRHRVSGSRFLAPLGFEATRWGSRIIPESQGIYPKTFSGAYGWPTVDHKKRYLKPQGIVTYAEDWRRWGGARFWNERQIITQEENAESMLWPPKWPQWTLVKNRNAVLTTFGADTSRVGRAEIANRARPVLPHSIAAPALPEYQKTGAVTHRVRPLSLDGVESLVMSRWAVVWNKADPLYPKGIAATLFGQTSIINTRRFFKFQGLESGVLGYPFIAFAIRELAFEGRYGIEPPRLPLPKVDLHRKYLEPAGIDGAERGQSKLGLPILESKFNRITTRWAHSERAGTPTLKNMTPEIPVRGLVATEFGNTGVRLQWRPLLGIGSDCQVFGKAKIADRRGTITVSGINTMRIGDKLRVWKIGDDPITTQHIDLRMFIIPTNGDPQYEAEDGYGIAPSFPEGGIPDLTKGYIFHNSLVDDFHKVGRPVVTANTIRVEPGIGEYLFGEPFVDLSIRVLAARTIGPQIIDGTQPGTMGSWGLPRVSPHTIYAVSEAPAQARRNHGTIGSAPGYVNAGISLGLPRISQQGQLGALVWPYRLPDYQVPSPLVYNKRQIIVVGGFNMMRLGLVKIPGPQKITFEEPLFSQAMGIPDVSRPPYVGPLYMTPEGWAAGDIGKAEVTHFHRTVRPQGLLSEAMGNSNGNWTGINMPHGLHIGPPILHQQEGFDASGHGTPWISHRIREIQCTGWESFLCEYDYQNFKLRMQVRRTGESSAQWRVLMPTGFIDTRMGTPNVRPGVHFIRPDGNSDQFRKGVHL